MAVDAGRRREVERILESLASWSRVLAASRTSPFGDVQLTHRQIDALVLIAYRRSGVGPGELAGLLGLTPGGVSQMLDVLSASSLVEVVPDPNDGRRRIVTLTTEARSRLKRFEAAAARELAPRFDQLGDAELDQLADLLARTTDLR